ncbi:glucose dehydrogenase [Shinella sumterensis]|uniref:PQQ-dependent sugar dehydrogenase n=1 Tax=Shinella sumterensis TaxID=1967501 RepID=UPI00106DF2E1|nr:PQQ-dependent sugar dehydrogenase [Shinella sumterensis]MCD1266646.1 PQQ-dependent sugar dehydrogenase [Shinella sumterensis]TFE96643.1 glucose dehydrogenase [Shinella sumterensis]
MRTTSFFLAGTMLAATLLAAPAFAQTARTAETGQANAPDQKPAFEGQTRATLPDSTPEIAVDVVAQGLPHLWAMEFLPDGRMLVTAKAGTMHVVSQENGEASPAIEGVPEVMSDGQGGLLDVALAPDFESSNRIYFSYSEPREGGNGTSVASATLAEQDGKFSLQDVKVIFQQMPTYDGDKHFGSRLVFGPQGELYVTVGERSDAETRVGAQDLGSGFGKVFRLDAEGKAHADNPFATQDGALPEIWSYGHRNLQSATLDGQGRLWTVEHGPKGGDELNRPEAGKNYGWPKVTYGVEYSGGKVGEGITALEGTEQPVYYWDPVIGPSGMAYYDGDAIPEWKGAFLIGGLVSQGLVVLHMDGDKVAHEERVPLDARIRDVKVASDGSVFAVTEPRGGGESTILRLVKR